MQYRLQETIQIGQRAAGSADPALVFVRRGGSQSWVHHAARIYYDTEKFNFETAAPAAPGSHSFGKRMVIKHNGYVGIGDDAPDYMLQLKGTIPAIALEDTSGTHGLSVIEQNDDCYGLVRLHKSMRHPPPWHSYGLT